MTVGGWIQELKRFSGRAHDQDGDATRGGTAGRYLRKAKREMQIGALKKKGTRGAKEEMYGEENIIFRSDPQPERDNAPSACDFIAVDQAKGNLSAKDVIGDKENAQDTEEIS